MSALIFILIIIILVLVHEWGHYKSAKIFGIRVDEFGIGFPPKVKTLFERNGTKYTLNWIPFGGFVKIFGENGRDELQANTDEGKGIAFYNAKKYKQAIVLFAGVFMNYILAALIFFVIFAFGTYAGVEGVTNSKYVKTDPITIVQSILPDYPAGMAGVLPGDVIVSMSYGDTYIEVPTPTQIIDAVSTNQATEYNFVINRDGENMTIGLSPTEGDSPKVGIMMSYVAKIKYPVHVAFVKGFETASIMFGQVTKGIIGIFTGHTSIGDISGPVGIVGIVGDIYKIGFTELLAFTALISLNLAVINLVPFPALDGGRLLFVGMEAITRKPVPQKFFEYANATGFILLIGLMILVTVRDVLRLF